MQEAYYLGNNLKLKKQNKNKRKNKINEKENNNFYLKYIKLNEELNKLIENGINEIWENPLIICKIYYLKERFFNDKELLENNDWAKIEEEINLPKLVKA